MLAQEKIGKTILNDIVPASNSHKNENPIRVIELFAGIGSQNQALTNLGIPHEVVAISEIDKWAIIGYEALHGPVNNLGDITKIEHLPECDLITYSFPCQDLSIAGFQRGMKMGSNTRSSLLWEVGRLLDDMKERNVLPEVLLMENVDAILNKRNLVQFQKWIMTLNEMGYVSSYAVMNAKDYGIPQNRKRCFMVSTLTKGKFDFPKGFPLETRLKDHLEDDVDESYYLSEERIKKFEEHRLRNEANGNNFGWHPMDLERERVVNPITTNPVRNASGNFVKIPKSDCQGEPGIIIAGDLNDKRLLEKDNRVYSADGVAPSLTTLSGGGKVAKVLEETDKIIVAGELDGSEFVGARTVYSADGVAPTITTVHPGIGQPKVQIKGTLGKRTQHNTVYGGGGIAPTLAACDWKDPLKVVVKQGGLNE